MDDLSSHFYATVGQLLDHAALGRLRVRLELADGGVADGVPFGAPDYEDGALDDTGYPRRARVDGQVVALDSVRHATIFHPDDLGLDGSPE
jgi:hypothetical protein